MERVSAVTLHFILNVLETKYRLNTQTLLQELDIDPSLFLEANTYVPSNKVKALFHHAARQCHDPHLALNLGAAASAQSLGLLGYMLANSRNIREMLERLCRFSELIGKNLRFTMTQEDTASVKIRFSLGENPLIPLPKHQVEIHLSALITLMNQLADTPIVPIKASFQYERTFSLEAYEALFGKTLCFNADENALSFQTHALERPLQNAYPGLLAYFESQAQKIIENLYDTDWSSRARKEMLLRLGNQPIDIKTVAKALNLAQRTLQTYLKSEGYSYSKLLEELRKKLSQYYLANFSIDIGTIALYLGYSDLSSFTRSFKLWYGLSPQAYRRTLPYSFGHAAIMPLG